MKQQQARFYGWGHHNLRIWVKGSQHLEVETHCSNNSVTVFEVVINNEQLSQPLKCCSSVTAL